MVLINDLTWATVPQFLACCFAVWALAQAVFRSMPAEAFTRWLMGRSRNSKRLAILQWELQGRTEWTERVNDPLAAQRKLTPPELTARAQEARQLTRRTVPVRVLMYLMGCTFCQHVWATLALLVVFASPSLGQLTIATLAYAGLVTLGSTRSINETAPATQGRSTCGGKAAAA